MMLRVFMILLALASIPAFGQPSPPPLNVTGTSPIVITPSGVGNVPRTISCPTCGTSSTTGTVTSVAPNADNNCIVTSPNPITTTGTIDILSGCLLPSSQSVTPVFIDGNGSGFSGIPNYTTLPPTLTAAMQGVTNNQNIFGLFGYGGNTGLSSRPGISGFRTGGTRTVPTATTNSSVLLGFAGWGWDATGNWLSAPTGEIWIRADEDFNNTSRSTYITFLTTPSGSVTEAQAMRINGNGNVLIGTNTDDGTDLFQVNGSIKVTSCTGCGATGTVTTTGSMVNGNLPQATGAASLNDSGIATSNVAVKNAAQSFTAAQRGAPATLTISTTTFTPNFDAAQNFSAMLVHASCPCTIANPSTTPVAGQSGMIAIAQSSTGSDTVTWGSQYKFAGATPPTLSTGANDVDFLPYYVFSATQIIVGAGVLNAH